MAVILSLPVLIGLIAVALAFDFLNGLHDSANSIATVVSTRVLRPRYAVMWAAFFNFIAFLVFGVHVAQTVGTGIVAADIVDARVTFSALMGAISWNLITWWAGIPSSSSHALIGGLVGAGVMRAGGEAIVWNGLLTTSAAIVLSPMTGFFLALILVLNVSWLFVRATPRAVDSTFPATATGLGVALLARPRRQRRPEDHGHHCCAAFLAGSARWRILRPVLGGDHLPSCHGPGNAVRRLAHRAYDGLQDHPADAGTGILRGDRRGNHAFCRNLAGHPGLDDTHHYWINCRRRGGAQSVCCSLERCE